jgi:hypothetical protein
LEVPELKMEDTQKNNELSLEADRDAGGGYNPYGGSTSGSKSTAPRGGGSRGTASGSAESRGATSGGAGSAGTRGGSNSGGSNVGGGYDPYGKGVTRKPGR